MSDLMPTPNVLCSPLLVYRLVRVDSAYTKLCSRHLWLRTRSSTKVKFGLSFNLPALLLQCFLPTGFIEFSYERYL